MLGHCFQAGITSSLRDCHELDQQQCLDEFYGAAGGDLWMWPWRWDLSSELADRPGVELDDFGRVITLELDFGEEEGEA